MVGTVMDILNAILSICSFVFVTFYVTARTRGSFKRLKGLQLKNEDIQAINEGGIVHLTTEDFAEKILDEKNIKSCKIYKRYSNGLKPCVYFFIYKNITNGSIKYNTGDAKTCGIRVEKLTPEQIKNLKVRLDDGAIIFCGKNFSFVRENEVSKVERDVLLKENIEAKSKRKNYYAFCCAIMAAIIGITVGLLVSSAICILLSYIKIMLLS